MSKHTEGPWESFPFGGQVWDSAGTTVCTMDEEDVDEITVYANARLIATSPEMKELLKTHLEILRSDDRYHYTQQCIAEIIAKAEGE